MANTYDTLRGRSRFQTVGVSDKMVRLKDYVIAKTAPPLSVPAVPAVSAGCYLKVADCTISQASPAVVHCVAHGLLDTRKVMFYTSGALLAPLVVGQIYFVVNKSDDDFNVALTSGGSPIDTTNAGSGTHSLHPLVI